MSSTVIDKLLPELEQNIGKKIKCFTNFNLLSSGWESIIYSFKITFDDNTSTDMVMRVYQGNDTDSKAEKEFKIMKILFDCKILVPDVHLLDISKNFLPKNFILMEQIHGILVGDRMIEKIADKNLVSDLFTSLVLIHKKIHSLPINKFQQLNSPLKIDEENDFIPRTLNFFSNILIDLKTDIFKDLLSWLKENAVFETKTHLGLLHLDFHPWNALITDGGDIFIIDWASATIGDIRFDIAWSLLLLFQEQSFDFSNKFLAIYKTIYQPNQLLDLEYFFCLAGLRRLVDAYIILYSDPPKQGLNPESKNQVKRMFFHYSKIIEKLEDISSLDLHVIKEKLLVET